MSGTVSQKSTGLIINESGKYTQFANALRVAVRTDGTDFSYDVTLDLVQLPNGSADFTDHGDYKAHSLCSYLFTSSQVAVSWTDALHTVLQSASGLTVAAVLFDLEPTTFIQELHPDTNRVLRLFSTPTLLAAASFNLFHHSSLFIKMSDLFNDPIRWNPSLPLSCAHVDMYM